ncbi:MAG TPA: tetratricopeptide repeat protein, partial [Fimbriimonadaceae bacterium]|nr:tetratricopeptide repeat protein [Fimbriimonadaceae bacterium]
GVCHGGQIVVSEAVREECGDDVPFVDLGRHRLKDLLRAEHVFEVTWSDQTFPPLRSLNALDHNLPVQLTSFIGRESDIAELEEALSRTRLVTLTGFGGAGKTRLALQVAAQAVGTRFQSVRFVSLSELPSGGDVSAAFARGSGIPPHGTDDPLGATIEAYADQEALFVVDNCEHVADSTAAALQRLLDGCPDLRFLATSRERLGLSGEKIVALEALSLPKASEAHPVRALESEAVSLFVDRVRHKGGRFVLDAASTPGTVRLVRALDGVPLAIEQAAARVASLGLKPVVERLGRLLDVLASSDRDIEPRQRTVRATISWSHDLLDEREKNVFAQVSTFQGAFLLSEASALVGRDVIAEIESLAQKSLLSPVEFSSQMRGYRLLELIRDYGRERIPEDAPGAFDSHTAWSLSAAEQICEELISEFQSSALDALERIYDDLMVAVRRTVRDRSPLALPLAFAMRRAWLIHGPTTDGVEWLEMAVMEVPHDDRWLVADAHNALGAMANACGMREKAVEHLESSLAQFEEIGDLAKVAAVNVNLGITLAMEGSFETAKSAFEAGIAAYRQTTDDRGLASAHLNFGRMLLDSGAPDLAAVHYGQALEFYSGRDPLMETTILTGLAEIYAESAPARALDSVERALAILQHAHDPSKRGMILVQLSTACLGVGLYEEAAFCAEAARATTERLGATWSVHAQDQLAKIDAAVSGQMQAGEASAVRARANSSTDEAVIEYALSAVRRARAAERN